jgi:plasmid stability protein
MIALERAMGQILVRNIDDEVRRRLKLRAGKHGHSMEQEIRDILRDAVKDEEGPQKGLGTRIAERFRGLGLREKDFPKFKITPRFPKFGR